MPKNRLRERLLKRETSCGLWVTLESATVTEIAVTLGLDWVCIDMEHGHLGFREVMEHVIAGKLNKQIAFDLGTGEQNIKIHRGRMMHKMGLESVADLVRIAEKLGIGRKED